MVGPASDRVRVRRRAPRGDYDRAAIDAILDEGLVAHVSVVIDGIPSTIPTAYFRDGDDVVLHGSSGNRVFRAIRDGAEACVCVTLLDGLVLARSAFHHSINYRSVVVYGHGAETTDPEAKRRALEVFVEHVVPGRSSDTRPPSDDELRQTLVVRIPIAESSAKIRTGPPVDDEADLALAHWAGEIPLAVAPGTPIGAPELDPDAPVPGYVAEWQRRRRDG